MSVDSWRGHALDAARWSVLATVIVAPLSTAATSVGAGLMLLLLVASGAAHRVLANAVRQPLGIAILSFIAVLFVGALYSPVPWADRWSALWSWRKLAWGLLALGLFVEPVWKSRAVRALVAVMTLAVVASWMAWLGWIPTKEGLPGVIFTNQTTQAMAFALTAFVSVAARGAFPSKWQPLLVVLALACAANVGLTSISRSSYLALAVMFLVWLSNSIGWRRFPFALGASITVAVAAYLASPMVEQRVDQAIAEYRTPDTQGAQETSFGLRAVMYQTSLELIASRPWLGYGVGNIEPTYAALVGQRYQDVRAKPMADPHNNYLFVVLETGLVGLAVFLAVLATAFITAARSLRSNDPYSLLAMGILLAWSLTSLFSSHFKTFAEGHMVWMWLGILLAGARLTQSTRPEA